MSATPSNCWQQVDCNQFVINYFLSQSLDEPTQEFLRKAITHYLQKLLWYTQAQQALHLFVNPILDESNKMNALEIDFMRIDITPKTHLGSTGATQPPSESNSPTIGVYQRVHLSGFEIQGCLVDLREMLLNLPLYSPQVRRIDAWRDFANCLCTGNPSKSIKPAKASYQDYFPTLSLPGNELIAIALSDTTFRFPAGQLGTVLLSRQTEGSAIFSNESLVSLRVPIKQLSVALRTYLTAHHGVTENTYLPSYRRKGPKSVGILFADIRDFTPATEILRNFNLMEEFVAFIHGYAEAMGAIINEHHGRVQSFGGDGIMAVFGEYNVSSFQCVTECFKAARCMLVKFAEIREAFFRSANIIKFFQNEYEPLAFSLGIGLNFGPVFFDYFGSAPNRTFSPIGDHVNFAQRLESQAGRFDVRLARRRSAILVSRPFKHILNQQDQFKQILLEIKGKPHVYEAFEARVGIID